MIRAGLDTNILVYLARVSEDARDVAKAERASAVLDRLRDRVELVVPVQALGEFSAVLLRNRVPDSTIERYVDEWCSLADNPTSSVTALQAALQLSSQHRLKLWDALIVAVSLEAGCGLLLSEDMQDGFAIRGLTVINPLADKPHRAVMRLLEA